MSAQRPRPRLNQTSWAIIQANRVLTSAQARSSHHTQPWTVSPGPKYSESYLLHPQDVSPPHSQTVQFIEHLKTNYTVSLCTYCSCKNISQIQKLHILETAEVIITPHSEPEVVITHHSEQTDNVSQ